ncbi:MAG: heparan-alpha-glucosaminide N-acetyltransferase domain-containing protein [Planctomycetota bacterium]
MTPDATRDRPRGRELSSAAAGLDAVDGLVVQAPETAARARAPRVWFVDILRLIASFQMINGHTLDAVMVTAIRHGEFYERYLWFRGLVSVTFLAVAGIAFHLSTLCRFEKHKGDPAAVRRRFRRAGIIILVGYLLAFPWGAFNPDASLREAAWYYFRSVGVLHCIGASLIALELVTLLARRASQVVWASAVLALGCFAVAPFMDARIADDASHWGLNWVSHQGGSPFPLFPWAGFVFAGLVAGSFAMPQGGRTPFARSTGRFALVTLGAAALWGLALLVPWRLFDVEVHHPATAPAHSLEKLVAVLSLVVLLAIACRPLRNLPAFFRALSSETLVIYAFHLVVLFYPGIAIARRFDHSLSLPRAAGVSAFMLVLTCGFTWFWHRAKARLAARAARVSPGR